MTYYRNCVTPPVPFHALDNNLVASLHSELRGVDSKLQTVLFELKAIADELGEIKKLSMQGKKTESIERVHSCKDTALATIDWADGDHL